MTQGAEGEGGAPPGAARRELGSLGDRYELQGELGRGGMAVVYRARDRLLDRMVAVKVLREFTDDDTARARFTGEARVLAKLNHPGLVTVLDAGTSGDRPYLVLELVDGPSLADICRGVALDPAHVAGLGAQLADALSYVHAAGIVHRDVKPANVLLGSDQRARLTDFGIARLLDDAARHTATGFTMGTAAYIAPEQMTGKPVAPATDVYSFGLTLLEALTGERAYPGGSMESALSRLSAPLVIADTIPQGWRTLVEQMTAREPGDRLELAQVGSELRALAAGLNAGEAATQMHTQTLGTRLLLGDDLTAARTVAHSAPTAIAGGIGADRAPTRAEAPTRRPSEHDPATAGTMMLSPSLDPPRLVRRRSLGRTAAAALAAMRSTPAIRPWQLAIAAAGCALLLFVVLTFALTRSDGDTTGTNPGGGTGGVTSVPSSVPSPLRSDLQQLRNAVNG